MNLQRPENPYQALGIERDATELEVKQAYFSLVREHSPERDPEGFKRIRAAYEQLRSTSIRAETDLFLMDEPDAPPVLKPAEAMPITLDRVKQDLIALEAFLFLEELRSGN
jgi:curved DNA-binding protein CbpA